MPRTVRHLQTGTLCPGRDCEECATQWLLTGNAYLTVLDAPAPVPSSHVPGSLPADYHG